MGLLKVVGTKKVWCQINEDTMKLKEVNTYLMFRNVELFRTEVNKRIACYYKERIERLENVMKDANAEMQKILLEMAEIGIEMGI